MTYTKIFEELKKLEIESENLSNDITHSEDCFCEVPTEKREKLNELERQMDLKVNELMNIDKKRAIQDLYGYILA